MRSINLRGMIKSGDSRVGYIGGSDMGMVYGSFDSATFNKWWMEKVSGLPGVGVNNKYTRAGDLLEDKILEEVGVDRVYYGAKEMKEGTIAGASYDALEWDAGSIVHEAKTARISKMFEWLLGYALNPNYKRQIYHCMWVCGAERGRLHVLGLKDEEYGNPFGVDVKGRVISFDFHIRDFDVEEHERRILYLSECYWYGFDPSNKEYEMYRMLLLNKKSK